MKTKVATLLLTVAMAGALFAGPAVAYDHDRHDGGRWHEEWRYHHPPVYAYNNYRAWNAPILPRPGWHWRLVDGHWRWVR